MAPKYLLPAAFLIAAVVARNGDGICGVSWGAQRIDIFGADSKLDVFHKYYTAFGWGPDDPAHGNLEIFGKAEVASPVSVASWGPNRLDFAFIDTNGDARHKYWDGSSWGPGQMEGYDTLGKGVVGKIALNSWGENRFDVVALSDAGTYVHKAWVGNGYYPPGEVWENFGGEFASPPATVSWGSNRLDIFGLTYEGNVSHKWWDGYQWNPSGALWENLGGKGFSGTISASSPHNGRFDIWAIEDGSGELWHLFWDGQTYRGWENLGGNFWEAPQVVHWAPNRIDIVGKDAGKNRTYEHKYWDGHQWSDWQNKGGPFHSEPAVVNIGENNLNIVGVGKDGKLKLQVWDGSQWLPAFDGWYELGDTKATGDSAVKKTKSEKEKVLGDAENGVRIELKFKA